MKNPADPETLPDTAAAPFFSVVMLYWNSERFLAPALDALEQQTCRDFELILLDNGSPEPLSAEALAEHPLLPLRLLRSENNLGFAGGNNLAARSARGEYLVLLNADAFPQPEWLAELRAAARRHPGACFASRQLKADDPTRLDGEWNVYAASGLAWRKAHGQPLEKAWPAEREVISACAAASAGRTGPAARSEDGAKSGACRPHSAFPAPAARPAYCVQGAAFPAEIATARQKMPGKRRLLPPFSGRGVEKIL